MARDVGIRSTVISAYRSIARQILLLGRETVSFPFSPTFRESASDRGAASVVCARDDGAEWRRSPRDFGGAQEKLATHTSLGSRRRGIAMAKTLAERRAS